MPIYLIHGFMWRRTPIREFVILQDVNDAAPDYLMQATTPAAMKAALTKLHPNIMNRIPEIHFIEQHDPANENPDAVTQPYAFVADKVHEDPLHMNVRAVQENNPITAAAWDAFADLKEALSVKSEIGWYVVYNGDPKREAYFNQQDPEQVEETEPVEEMSAEVENVAKKGKDNIFKRILSKGSRKTRR